MEVEYKRVLEICVDSYEDALIAVKGGACRLELCSRLDLGGLTPDFDLVKQLIREIDIPIRVMIRPREGNFCYSNSELDQMIAEVERFKNLTIEGFVWGCLLPTNHVDRMSCERLMEVCEDYLVTFHRAFDVIRDQERALQQLIDLGIDKILTSGVDGHAIDGLEILAKLVSISGNRISIMPGGGIMPENAEEILTHTKARAIHASLNCKGFSYGPKEKVEQLKFLIS